MQFNYTKLKYPPGFSNHDLTSFSCSLLSSLIIININIIFQEDILSLWNRTANDTGVTNRIRDTFRRVLNLPPGTTIEYKAHNDSIKYVMSKGPIQEINTA